MNHVMKTFMSLELQGQPIVNLVYYAQIKNVYYPNISKFPAKRWMIICCLRVVS